MPTDRNNDISSAFAAQLLQLVHEVADPIEIKVILATIALGGSQKPVSERDLLLDQDLLAGARADGSSRSAPDRIRETLGAAVARGMLIALSAEDGERWYVLASVGNRRKAHAGTFVIPDLPKPIPLPIQRPGVYALYEQNIGLLSPLIADRLADALLRYPEEWIAAAIGEAVAYNRRSWRYVERILENWATEGRSDETHRRNHETDGSTGETLRDKYREYLRRR